MTLTAPAPPQPPAPGAERGPLRIPAAAWVVPPLLLILGFVGWPMATVLGESVHDQNGALSLTSWSTVLTSGEFRNALLRTAQIAVGSTIGALILGSFLRSGAGRSCRSRRGAGRPPDRHGNWHCRRS